MNSQILAIDYFLPEQIVKTTDLMAETNPARFDFTNELLADLLGIQEVRYSQTELPSTLALKAIEKILVKSAIRSDEIDLVIFCGIDRDYAEPSTAHIVQAAIGCRGICFDVTNACLGFMTGIQIATEMIKSGAIRYALICTGERPSVVAKNVARSLKSERKRSIFWNKIGALSVGDAGAAAIIGPKMGESGLVGMNFASTGELAKLCCYSWQESGSINGQMKMKEISNAILDAHKRMLPDSMRKMGLSTDRIDCLITHQVGKRPWERYSGMMGIAREKMTKTFDSLGNITSATFAVNYTQALEQGKIKKGDLVFAAMAGSGLSVCQMALIG